MGTPTGRATLQHPKVRARGPSPRHVPEALGSIRDICPLLWRDGRAPAARRIPSSHGTA
jgi:hypothetical protein